MCVRRDVAHFDHVDERPRAPDQSTAAFRQLGEQATATTSLLLARAAERAASEFGGDSIATFSIVDDASSADIAAPRLRRAY